MKGFTLLWGKLLKSSIWINGTKEDRILWVAMLAMKDSEGKIECSLVGLADTAKITPDECRAALVKLLSPDPDDTSGVEEGRKLRVIPGGWQVVNHDLYRFSTAEKREFWRREKAEQRRLADLKSRTPGTVAYCTKVRDLGRKLRKWHKLSKDELGVNGNPTAEEVAEMDAEHRAAVMPEE